MVTIIGGVYHEWCMHPGWQEVFGSGGRAASAITALGGKVELWSCFGPEAQAVLEARAFFEGFSVKPPLASSLVQFHYLHGLATPKVVLSPTIQEAIKPIAADKVVQYGMLEADVQVHADQVVFDPQNVGKPRGFGEYGSTAKRLALVLNRYEAQRLSELPDAPVEEQTRVLAEGQSAEVVIIKLGPQGALVYHDNRFSHVPAYKTSSVWKIGSGDVFVASFGYFWMDKQMSPVESATQASRATAYYCETKGFATSDQLRDYSIKEVKVSGRVRDGYKPLVYLAGPFFTLGQRWVVEQAREAIIAQGLRVFSPFHDVGLGSADDVVNADLDGLHKCEAVFAIADGLDAGTVFEIGFARALNKPVVVYCENESAEDRKMMEGSNCLVTRDFTSAVYQLLWAASAS